MNFEKGERGKTAWGKQIFNNQIAPVVKISHNNIHNVTKTNNIRI